MKPDGHESSRTRLSLLEGIKDPENRRRWEEFAGKYSGLIANSARMAGLRADEVEDLVQIVLLEVSAKIGEFAYDPSKGKFRGWLKTLTVRRAFDQTRKRERATELSVHRRPENEGDTGTIEGLEDLDQSALERAIDEEWMRALSDSTLKAVRERVSPEQFQLYDAYVVQDWPVKKVQKVFGVNANQVYTARTRVSKVVKEEGARIAKEMDSPEMPPEPPTTVAG